MAGPALAVMSAAGPDSALQLAWSSSQLFLYRAWGEGQSLCAARGSIATP